MSMLKGLAASAAGAVAAVSNAAYGTATPAQLRSVEHLVGRRTFALDYMKRALRGETYFMNVALLSIDDVVGGYSGAAVAAVTKRYFVLLLSLGRILSLDDTADVLRAACQLMAEFEHFCGETMVPDALLSLNFRRGVAEDYYPDSITPAVTAAALSSTLVASGGVDAGNAAGAAAVIPAPASGAEAIKPALHTAGGAVVYEFVVTPPVPYASLDYLEVVTTLLETLGQLYTKLLDTGAYAAIPHVVDAIARCDTRLKHFVVKPLMVHLCTVATKVAAAVVSAAAAEALPASGAAAVADAAAAAAAADGAPSKRPSSSTLVLTGGLLHKTAAATAQLRAAADAQLGLLAAISGGAAVGIDSGILCGILPGTGDASRDLSSDYLGVDDGADAAGAGAAAAGASGKGKGIMSVFSGLGGGERRSIVSSGGGGGGGGKGLLSSKPPTAPEVPKHSAGVRTQLGAYFSKPVPSGGAVAAAPTKSAAAPPSPARPPPGGGAAGAAV